MKLHLHFNINPKKNAKTQKQFKNPKSKNNLKIKIQKQFKNTSPKTQKQFKNQAKNP